MVELVNTLKYTLLACYLAYFQHVAISVVVNTIVCGAINVGSTATADRSVIATKSSAVEKRYSDL